MKSPKVSIVIPTYNRARFLPEAIESVLNQDFRDFELLIIDDQSDDNSPAVLEHYAALDKRVRFQVNFSSGGMVAAWNQCLAQARGDYVKLLCSDDKLATAQTLGKLVALLDDNPTAVLAASVRSVINERSMVEDVWQYWAKPGVKDGRSVIMECLEQGHNLIGEPSVVLFRRDKAGRGFNPRYFVLVDLEMWFHLLEQGDFAFTPEPLCSFRRHGGQLTAFVWAHGIGRNEMDMLLSDYLHKPWLQQRPSKKSLFLMTYTHRKRERRGVVSPGLDEQLLARLGRGWYAALWLAYKATKPVTILKNSARKHLFGNPSRSSHWQRGE